MRRMLHTADRLGCRYRHCALNQGLEHFNILFAPDYQEIILIIICGFAFGLLFFTVFRYYKTHSGILSWVENKFIEIPMPDIVSGSVGL